MSLLSKWRTYSRKYGATHAACRFVGSRMPVFWRIAGPIVSRRYRERWMRRPGPKILNLGGGSHCTDHFLTADIDAGADTFVDMTMPLPFADGSFDGILLEEAIEHISKRDGARMLTECARICRPGGTIRIATPDLEWFCSALLSRAIDPDDINLIFYGHNHRHIYGRGELADALRQAGLSDVRASSYKDPNSRLGHLDTHAERFQQAPEISQYVEALR